MKKVKRRSLLQLGALSGVTTGLTMSTTGLSMTPDTVHGAIDGGVKEYVRLGRTGFQVSDVSFGSFPLQHGDERVVLHAMDRGINYFDTAESYGEGVSEEVMGKALKGGRRKSVKLATKIFAGGSTSASSMMARLDACLKRLQTDYIDVFFNHAVNDIRRLQNPEWLEFTDKARSLGKVRYFGMSGHAGRLTDCIEYALDKDMFDVMLLAMNFGDDPAFYERFTRSTDLVANQQGLPKLLAKAKQQDVGIVAMKVLRGARLNDMRPYEREGSTYAQAACRWILNNPDVDNLIITMRNRDEVDEYLGASGSSAVSRVDMELLQQYARQTEASYCRNVCNDCEGSCPYDVPIPDILRMHMYATDYGDYSVARNEYARLEHNASACLSCDGSPCQDACTFNIPVADLCGPTHQLLS
ncbi:MAG: hypothetical protein HN816_12900 [Gammaproteobacteria bacterium]|nr:hypothetical protein [Gammaproteobacteria bacterium]